MDVVATDIEGVLIVKGRAFQDERGFFTETWNRATFAAANLDIDFVQDNFSMSRPVGTVRGLHFQTPPWGQAKLVRCMRGSVLDVAVDLRHGSPTFGHHVAVTLTAANQWALFIPEGFAHGFMTLEPESEVLYKVTRRYAPENDGGILWNDPDLGIDWPTGADKATVSPKDKVLPRLKDLPEIWRMG